MKVKTSFENRLDGSEWRRYTTSTGVEVVITSAFREIMKNGEAKITGNCDVVGRLFLQLLHRYREQYEAKSYGDIRRHVASGQEAQFYGVDASNIGVREEHYVGTHEDKLDRMDTIAHLLDLGGLPRWIRCPVHYGMLKVPQMVRGYYNKFMVIQKIDHGVTAFDILDEPRTEAIGRAIIDEFSSTYGMKEIGDENYKIFQAEVRKRYQEVKKRLQETFETHKAEFPGWTFQSLFADLFARNLLVSFNETPIGGSRLSFWIIDQ